MTPAGRPAPPGPPDPETSRVAVRRVLHFGLLLLVVVVVGTMPFPWRDVALLAAVAAIVAGVRAIVAARRARTRPLLVVALSLGLALSATIVLQSITSLLLWDVEAAYQECLDGAITVDATARCDAERTQGIEDWTTRLGGGTVTP
ncbi:hypothetical protein [Cellulosimicrobium arenosum]|uniref:Uncharacterized protein n=1 Tax=Cellulosimicrobium arenosum TaxID=2708133 RepID=A0A927IZ85_9MICO|nr:hypothetical protein [Cellulosimicrobium arenosum]MBD8078279.1 hypothetical protein [Cellulosimicrobium arenosum]